MEPLARAEGIPEVWARITDEREAMVQFPYPLTRPHLPSFPKYRGSDFAASQVTMRWVRHTDRPWQLLSVVARGRRVKHNGHLSGSDQLECRFAGHDVQALAMPPLLATLVAEYAPKEA